MYDLADTQLLNPWYHFGMLEIADALRMLDVPVIFDSNIISHPYMSPLPLHDFILHPVTCGAMFVYP